MNFYRTAYPRLVILANDKSWMSAPEWKIFVIKGMKAIKRFDDGKQSFLYSDNCGSHVSEHAQQTTQIQLQNANIYQRQLIPNSTALAQPVDQNVGHTLANLIRVPFEALMAKQHDRILARRQVKKINLPALRRLVAKWTNEAWQKLLLKEHLLTSAWDNCGLIDVWMDDDE